MAEQLLGFWKIGPRVLPDPWPTQVRWVYDDATLDVTHIEYEGTDHIYGKERVDGEAVVRWREAGGQNREFSLLATPLGTPLRERIPPGLRWTLVATNDPELGPGLAYPAFEDAPHVDVD